MARKVLDTVTLTSPLDTRVLTDPGAFELTGWQPLVDMDPKRQIFATPLWNKVWWEEFGANKELFVLTMHRLGDLVAIVPLYRKVEDGRKVLRFVGGIDLTDYLGPICLPEDRGDVADSLLAWLERSDVEWDEFDAHNMPVPFGFAEILVERLDRYGFSFGLEQEETSGQLCLPPNWDTYVSSLSSKDRHELRRKRRRLLREHPDLVARTSGEDDLELDLKIFIEMHRGADGLKGHFMRPEIATFFERMAHAFAPLGWLRLDILEISGTPIAGTFSFEYANNFYLYNSAYEPEAKRMSPGFVLTSKLIKEAIGRGVRTFDFMRGHERYKYQLGAEAVPLNNVRISRSPGTPDAPSGRTALDL
jgi:CelD/BcsL family acetyltransferase involved in cellulose biosynthesis